MIGHLVAVKSASNKCDWKADKLFSSQAAWILSWKKEDKY
jgi:hypothetical protein